MKLQPLIVSGLVCLLLGAGVVGYRNRDRWAADPVPAKPAGNHAGHVHDENGNHIESGDQHARSDRVKLSPQAQANLKLDVDTIEPRAYWRSLLIPGIVVDRPGESDRTITAKLAGVVLAITAKPGDSVRAGDTLFKLQVVSEFVQSAQNDLAKAVQELAIATAKRERTAGLVALGTTPAANLIDDDANIKRFTTQTQALRRQLQVFGLTAAQLDAAERGKPVTEVAVTATGEAGQVYEVQDLKIQLGESVQAGQALGTLANHQKLYVEGRAFKAEASALAETAQAKAPVRAEFTDEPPGVWPVQGPLTIHHLSNQVDPTTRTFAFYLPLDNQPRTYEQDGRTHFVWRYRPGQRVRLHVPVEKLGDSVYVLPAGSVVREGADAYMFVQNGDLFMRKPVRVLAEDRREVVLPDDGTLSPAMFVVKNQAAAINRALKAGGSGGHKGHAH